VAERREPTEGVAASVLVPVLDEEEHIREAVDAMRAQELDGEIEFLFMDGGSRDGTRAILEELAAEDSRIRVFDNPGRTTPYALNVGLANARGEYVVRMDAHAFYPPRYVAAGIERLQKGDVEWVSGPAIPRAGGAWSRRVVLALNSGPATIGSRKWHPDAQEGGSGEVELDTGVFAGVWRRSTLERYGGWDTGWPINQDSELAARVLADGGRIVMLPEMGAEYVPRDSLGGLWKQYWRYGFYRGKTSRRHPHSLRRSHLLAPGLATAVAGSVIGPRLTRVPARAALASYVAALVVASARAAQPGAERDAAALPVVFFTMHMSFAVGFMWSAVRFGPPLGALAHLAGLGPGRAAR
jgi:glycosyltransferase involved in cell wall biosynthesis